MNALVARVTLAGIAAALVAGAIAYDGDASSSGNWTAGATFEGHVAPGEARTHALEVALPAAWDSGGVRVDPAQAELSLRAGGAIEGAPYAIDVVDADGALVLRAAIDPANPFTMPHGPPSAAVGPGAYAVRVTPAGEEAAEYTLSVVLTLPFSAGATGLVVPPTLPWGLAALALVGALFPIPRLARGTTKVNPE